MKTTSTKGRPNMRHIITRILILAVFVALLGRLVYIQIITSNEYKELAVKNQQVLEVVPPERGKIYDRTGNLLATNKLYKLLAVHPVTLCRLDKQYLKSPNSKYHNILNNLSNELGKVLAIPPSEIKKQIIAKSNKGNDYYRIEEKLPLEQLSPQLQKYSKEYFGVLKIENVGSSRQYLYNNIASQVLGKSNSNNEGILGVELKYNKELAGLPGEMIMYKDKNDDTRPALDKPIKEPVNGADIYLTIDVDLQKVVEFELRQGVLKALAHSGTTIIVNVHSGEILAAASYPNFNPNIISKSDSANSRLRFITDIYEPGSTFKAITAASALEDGVVQPNDMFNGHQGTFALNSRTITDDHPLGFVNFREAFKHSSNIILSEVATRITDINYKKHLEGFGFGMKTEIDLPGEQTGTNITTNLIRNNKRSLGYGYGIAITPLQLLMAYSAIANGGTLMKPYIVKYIRKNDEIIKEQPPIAIRKVISPETSKQMTELLKAVVEGGTGKKAKIDNLKIAGKTGTAKKIENGVYQDGKYIASFCGYFPADNPELAMLVIVDEPKAEGMIYGGSAAAPIFKNIALRCATINPNLLLSNSSRQTKNDNFVVVPNLIGLNTDDAKIMLNYLGLTLNTNEKHGIISSQTPKPGSSTKKNKPVVVNVNSFSSNSNSMPDVKGLSLRKAINILNNANIPIKVQGKGLVIEQKILNDTCILICK